MRRPLSQLRRPAQCLMLWGFQGTLPPTHLPPDLVVQWLNIFFSFLSPGRVKRGNSPVHILRLFLICCIHPHAQFQSALPLSSSHFNDTDFSVAVLRGFFLSLLPFPSALPFLGDPCRSPPVRAVAVNSFSDHLGGLLRSRSKSRDCHSFDRLVHDQRPPFSSNPLTSLPSVFQFSQKTPFPPLCTAPKITFVLYGTFLLPALLVSGKRAR